MNTTGLATGGIVAGGVASAELVRRLPAGSPARVAGETVLAATGGTFVLLVTLAIALILVGFFLRLAARRDA